MMGRHHALLGGVVYLGVAGTLGHMSGASLAAATAACAGAAMLPDLDEPGSSVAHLCEPISGLVSHITAKLAGGHRKATHSLVAVAAAGLIGFAVDGSRIGSGVLLAVLFALFVRAVGPPGTRHGLVALGLAVGGAWACVSHVGTGWLVVALPAGVALHLVGDMMTSGGVPLFWPSPRTVSWPVLGHTDSNRETLVSAGLFLAFLALCWWAFAGDVGPIHHGVVQALRGRWS
ncbi:MAG: metal-dependent hydrolase [Acidimicrobiales bacterium]